MLQLRSGNLLLRSLLLGIVMIPILVDQVLRFRKPIFDKLNRKTMSTWAQLKINRKRLPTTHWSVLHTSVSSRVSGQEAPPFSGAPMTSLALVLVPPPQVALHSPHGFHSPTLQSTRNVKPWMVNIGNGGNNDLITVMILFSLFSYASSSTLYPCQWVIN